MIPFFRKIRKQFADDNKPLKYMRYAIGEIVLVVIGILIALSINNWNENRKNRITERKILLIIAENLEQNINDLEQILEWIERNDRSADIIFSVLRERIQENDTLGYHWHKAILNNANFTLSKGGYEALKNTGIEIISNEKLKTEIVKLYENTYLILEGRLKWGTEVNPSWDKYIIKNFRRGVGDDGGALYPRNYDFILNDDYFLGLLELAASQRSFFKRFIKESLDSSQGVLQLVQDELDKNAYQ